MTQPNTLVGQPVTILTKEAAEDVAREITRHPGWSARIVPVDLTHPEAGYWVLTTYTTLLRGQTDWDSFRTIVQGLSSTTGGTPPAPETQTGGGGARSPTG